MRYFHLRVENHEVEVAPGDLVVGRSHECGLVLNDDLASRRHARFTSSDGRLYVEDLGSRNGIAVNKVEVRARVELFQDDTVTVGQTTLVVSVSDQRAAMPRRRAAVTLPEGAGERATGMGSRGALIAEAFATHNLAAAEFHLSNLLRAAQAEIQGGRVDAPFLDEVARYAVRLASESETAAWLDWVFHLYHAAQRVLPGTLVNELHTVARRVRYPYSAPLRSYLDALRAQATTLGASDRFVLQRLEGLVGVLRAQGPG